MKSGTATVCFTVTVIELPHNGYNCIRTLDDQESSFIKPLSNRVFKSAPLVGRLLIWLYEVPLKLLHRSFHIFVAKLLSEAGGDRSVLSGWEP